MFISRSDLLRNLTNKIIGEDVASVSANVLCEVLSFFKAQYGAIYLSNSNDQLQLTAYHPESNPKLHLSGELIAYLANLKSVILFSDLKGKDTKEWPGPALEMEYGAVVFVPLTQHSNIVGFMLLGWNDSHCFKDNDDDLLCTIGNLLGIGLFNAHLIGGLQVREEELQTMCRSLMKAKEEEAKRISRELHDEVGQDLTTLVLRLKMLLKHHDLEDIHDDVKELVDMSRETLADVQRIAMNLRPSALDNLGLLPSINWYLEQYRADHCLEISFQHPPKLENLSEEQELLIYRVLLEILTNVARHAQATKAEIQLSQKGEQLFMRVRDDGIGMDLDGPHAMGLGLMGMQERVKEQMGSFLLESQLGQGTTVMINIPLKKAGCGNDKANSDSSGR